MYIIKIEVIKIKKTGLKLFNKINQVLNENNVTKSQLSSHLGISKTALSNQLKNLRLGKGINIKTLEAIKALTGFNFFSF